MVITEKDYVQKAEAAIDAHKNRKNEKTGKPIPMVTTSKLRNLLAMTADIYNEVLNWKEEALSDEICGRIEYLKIRFLYEAGRETTVKDFILKADILKVIDGINGSKKNYILFNRYMEALIAYHKFNDGKDN